MQDINMFIPNVPRERVWLFNSADSFSGNVKYLFIYITKYRPDIFACYITQDENNYNYIKSLGYRVVMFKSEEGKLLMAKSGVYVNEHIKVSYPIDLLHTKLLNLFHGVGLKAIERKYTGISMEIDIAKKYIQYNEYISHNMCFLVTSPFMEKHFREQLCLSENQIIRAGYPRNIYQKNFEKISSYTELDIGISAKSNTMQLALYAPTYREVNPENFLFNSLPDIEKLITVLEKNNIILIIKLHPLMKKNFYLDEIKKLSMRRKNIIIWDDKYDIYEILDKIDIGIIDYSSLYYDLVSTGVKKFIRYIFDFEIEKEKFLYDYFENTSGIICKNFNELLTTLDLPIEEDDTETIKKITEKFWSYSSPNACEEIIQQTLNFHPQINPRLPVLYSFDIFDTLIGRKVLEPRGIFYYVMEMIRQSAEPFPEIFKLEYVAIRMQAEANVREYVKKTIGDFEITFDSIFDRLNDIYDLSTKQIELLKKWELSAELENVLPLKGTLEFAEQLVQDGEQVVLISDMYLPKNIILQLIEKISPILAKVPLFLSSDYHVKKTTQKLYLKVYKYFSPYPFKEWHHYGDNKIADEDKAKKMGIIPHIQACLKFNAYERAFINRCKDYDSYLLAGMFARFRTEEKLSDKEYFAFAHVGCYLVPYIAWVVRDALKRGFNTLYFISRDGYFLKKIADAYITVHKLHIKTSYIYGSRRAWRLPSQFNSIDDDFFSYYGEFTGVNNYEKLLLSLHMPHHIFQKLFPELNISKEEKFTKEKLSGLITYFKSSKKYHEYLLKKSVQERKITLQYLLQEIDFSEQFAFVEFWARGYTQALIKNLISAIEPQIKQVHYYYYRSILPSQEGTIRYNYSTNNTSLLFIEAIFANHPYSTVNEYREQHGVILPKRDKIKFDTELFYAMEKYLEKFVSEFYSLKFFKQIATMEKLCSDVSLYWYRDHQDDPTLVKSLGHLLYTETIVGTPCEFAPTFTESYMELLRLGKPATSLTRSVKMSLARSTPEIRSQYQALITNAPSQMAPANVAQSRNLRLLAKLELNPEAFFKDSKKTAVRIAGRVCFCPVLRPILERMLISVTRKILTHSKKS